MSWNFSLILFVLLVVTGAVWLLDICCLRRGRKQRAQEAQKRYDQALIDDPHNAEYLRDQIDVARRPPWWVEYGASFFPMVLFIFALRSFGFEPFRIPSGSMMPTLESGDMIIVNKFSYGVRLPLTGTKLFETGAPARGDVVVFRYPRDTSMDYIKRVATKWCTKINVCLLTARKSHARATAIILNPTSSPIPANISKSWVRHATGFC